MICQCFSFNFKKGFMFLKNRGLGSSFKKLGERALNMLRKEVVWLSSFGQNLSGPTSPWPYGFYSSWIDIKKQSNLYLVHIVLSVFMVLDICWIINQGFDRDGVLSKVTDLHFWRRRYWLSLHSCNQIQITNWSSLWRDLDNQLFLRKKTKASPQDANARFRGQRLTQSELL